MADPRERELASHQVESEIEELGDPEAASPLPSGTLAVRTAAALPKLRPGTAPHPASNREILKLALPVMATGVLVSLAGLVDRAMIGRLGGEGGGAVPLAAVGFATQFFFLIQSTLFAIGLACVALMARAIGAGDFQRARAVLSASLQVATAVTAILMLPMLLGGRPLLGLLGAEPAVIESALPYLQLVIGSSLPLGALLTLDAALRANRDTRTPLWIALVVTATKLGGNAVLIFGLLGAPRLELVGAGLATALSQIVGLGLYVAVLMRTQPESPVAIRWRDLVHRSPLHRDVVRIALPGIAERLVMNFALLTYFWVLGRFYGTVAVAAYTVGVAVLSFSWIPGIGYAQACATLVGQSLGAGNATAAAQTGWRSARLALGSAVVLGILCGLLRDPLARLFTDDPQVLRELGPFMLALAVAQPFLQVHFTLGGAHRGAGDTWTPLLAASAGNWLLRVPLACFFAIGLELDLAWVWAPLILDHAARAGILTWTFRRGRWQTSLDRSGAGRVG